MLVRPDVLRSLEEHVLEQVGEARAPLAFVRRSHVIPEVHRDDWCRVILGESDEQTVRQAVRVDGYRHRGESKRRTVPPSAAGNYQSRNSASGALMDSARRVPHWRSRRCAPGVGSAGDVYGLMPYRRPRISSRSMWNGSLTTTAVLRPLVWSRFTAARSD